MAPVSTIKDVLFLASTLSTLSSELVFRTRAGVLEPGPRHWYNSRRVGLGFRGEVGISSEAPGHPCGHSTLQVWEVGTAPGVPGHPRGQSIFQCPHWQPVRTLGKGMSKSAAPTKACPICGNGDTGRWTVPRDALVPSQTWRVESPQGCPGASEEIPTSPPNPSPTLRESFQ